AADMFDNQIHAPLSGYFPHLGWPGGIIGIEDKFRAELVGQLALCFRRSGADDARAELFGDLNGGGTDSTRPADDEHPIAGTHLCASREHVHSRAASER